uniref:uronyl 2-sulfotransferase-like n=1 Tax=Ciona intestinalis TaxID=7719 RepID=UPI000180C6DA|nr:uronyl 2-sulfotransferase-like [Ciona intestinalis]|eukprot:XP_026690936.1 uronyl 2-sulfotransferase-like [Ciona intestinalis]
MNTQMRNVFFAVMITSSLMICAAFYGYRSSPVYMSRNYPRPDETGHQMGAEGYDHRGRLQGTEEDNRHFSRLVYNRVGKCGSRSMHNIISELSKINHFNFFPSNISNVTRPNIMHLKTEVELIQSLKRPMLYSRHIHYINFQKFGQSPPLYINMIRDPIERFQSQYYFKRYGDVRSAHGRKVKPWKRGELEMSISECVLSNHYECSTSKLWYIVPYFCGQDLMCKHPTPESLNRAKRHLIENYLAVGLLEDFESSLLVFEKLLPHHFKGAIQVWKDLQSAPNINTSTLGKEKISPEAYVELKKRMVLEYDFYNFTKALFNNLKLQLNINTKFMV